MELNAYGADRCFVGNIQSPAPAKLCRCVCGCCVCLQSLFGLTLGLLYPLRGDTLWSNDLFDLRDRVVIVTGASAGLGVGFAVAAANAGAQVVVAARRTDKLQQLADAIEQAGRLRPLPLAADVARPEDCAAVTAAAMNEFGRVDALITNAGVASAVAATRETPEQFRAVVDVNLCGSFWMAQACASVMRPGSAIVNISSVLALTTAGLPQAAYSASKAAVLGLTRDLAQQWGTRKGIRVNALAPGFFATEMTEQYPEGYLDRLKSRIVIGRAGEPRELAATALWLISDAAGYICGQTIVVDGGCPSHDE